MNATTKELAPRLLSISELTHYTGLGTSKAREWAKEIGAVRKIGRRVLYDKRLIDAALDGQEGEADGS